MSCWRLSRCWPLLAATLQPGIALAAGAADGAASTSASQPSPAADMRSREQLFRDVFGRSPPEIPVTAYLLVAVDGAAARKLPALFSPDPARLRVQGRALLDLLADRLRPEVLRMLEQKVDPEGWLDRPALQAAGIASSYDTRQFALNLTTDPAIRGRSIQYLSGRPPSTAQAVRPAAVSAFVNLNARAARVDESVRGVERARSTATLAADGAFNARGVVLEGSGYAQGGDGRGFQRGDVRLVHDRPEDALRFSAGDLRYPVLGYQTIVDMGGVGVTRDYSLQPYLRNYQSSQFEFYLERPADVRIWVNNSLVNTLRLPAGPHDIRGLTPAVGLNATRLVIEDVAGRIQTLEFSFIYSPLLLEPGTNLFSVNAGFRRRMEDGRHEYDADAPVASFSYLHGVRRNLTVGGYLQAERDRAVAGVHGVQAFEASTFQVDAAVRRTDASPSGVGAKANWIYLGLPRAGRNVQGQLGVEYLGAHFGTLNESVQATRRRVNVFGTVAVPLGATDTLQLAALYTPSRDAFHRDAHNASASWIRRTGPFSLTLGVRHRRSALGEDDSGAFFGLTYTFSGGGHNVHAAREPESGALAAAWSSTRPSTHDGPYGFASARHDPGDLREVRAGAGYWTHQGLVEAAHTQARVDHAGRRTVRDESAVRLQTAVVFAGGSFGLAPAVSENFAIVRGKEGLDGVPLRVDPDGSRGGRARTGALSPAVVPDLGNYLLRDIRVEPVDPPFGATPDKLSYALAPAYKSGILLELGREPRILAVGRLVDARGAGLAHVPVEVRRLGDTAAPPLRTFTSGNGGFQLGAMTPGRYEITPMGAQGWNTIIVDIPAAPDGLFRFGNLPATR